ncbi:holliday junction DNA helicase RuvA, partial [gut metagenome]
MIEYIKGKIDELTPTYAVVEAAGIGYQLFISLNTYSAVQGAAETKLYVYEAIREDAHLLYGFLTKAERELFLLLISVSGIGGQTARMILSAFSPAELANIIRDEDVKMLKSV